MQLKRAQIDAKLHQWNLAWNRYDFEAVMALFHEEVVFEHWTGARVVGKIALHQAWAPWFEQNDGFQFFTEDIFIDEFAQKALYHWRLEWPSREKGIENKPERRCGVDVLHFENGKIIRKMTFSKTTIEIDGKRCRLVPTQDD